MTDRHKLLRLGSCLLAVGIGCTACGSSGPGHSSGAAVMIATAKQGSSTFLTGASGRAVYLWEADHAGKSVCSGGCASEWPPVTTKGKPIASGSVTGSSLGTVRRSDGRTQVTYDGHPLYYYAGDQSAGSANGQGIDSFGARWWIVAPSGSAITTSAPSTKSSGGGGGYGY